MPRSRGARCYGRTLAFSPGAATEVYIMGRAHLMNPHRLCAAADSLLEAMGHLAATPAALDDRTEERPVGRTRVFTQMEINEAALMLARLGYLRSEPAGA